MRNILFLLCSVFLMASCTQTSTSSTQNMVKPGVVASGTTQPVSASPALRTPSPTYGSGKHELVVFADFQCPACIASAKSIMPIFEDYAKKGYLHITYKQFPLTGMHKNAERDALAALCVSSQGKGADVYQSYKKSLYAMEEKKAGATVSDRDRVEAAQGITEIDVISLASCIKNDLYIDQVHAEMKEGDDIGVNGTPTLYLDEKKLDLGVFRDTTVLQTVMNRLLEVPASVTATQTGSAQ